MKQLVMLAKQLWTTERQLDSSIEGGICNKSYDDTPRVHVYKVATLYKLFEEASALDPGHVVLSDKTTGHERWNRKLSFTFDDVEFYAYTCAA